MKKVSFPVKCKSTKTRLVNNIICKFFLRQYSLSLKFKKAYIAKSLVNLIIVKDTFIDWYRIIRIVRIKIGNRRHYIV